MFRRLGEFFLDRSFDALWGDEILALVWIEKRVQSRHTRFILLTPIGNTPFRTCDSRRLKHPGRFAYGENVVFLSFGSFRNRAEYFRRIRNIAEGFGIVRNRSDV